MGRYLAWLRIYLQYRKHHNHAYAKRIAHDIVFEGLPF